MKKTDNQSAFRSFTKLASGSFILGAGLLAANIAQAHLTYGGRDFGAFSGLTNGVRAITNQTCTGNYGWADAADGILGDSHRGRAFRFHLDNSALITLTVAPNPYANTNNPLGDLTPAFTIYSGLAAIAPFSGTQTDSDHDGSAASLAYRRWWVQQNIDANATTEAPTDGCWNSIADFRIGGDGDPTNDFSQLTTLVYKGSAASTTSGGTVTGTFGLPAGNYTIIIGGNDIANKTAGTALVARGIMATLSVTPAPPLSIAQKVFVAWPSGTATNWFLESSATVNGPTWNAVTNVPVVVDGTPGVVLDPSESQKYFRFNYAP